MYSLRRDSRLLPTVIHLHHRCSLLHSGIAAVNPMGLLFFGRVHWLVGLCRPVILCRKGRSSVWYEICPKLYGVILYDHNHTKSFVPDPNMHRIRATPPNDEEPDANYRYISSNGLVSAKHESNTSLTTLAAWASSLQSGCPRTDSVARLLTHA